MTIPTIDQIGGNTIMQKIRAVWNSVKEYFQPKLTAGTNIVISDDNVISASGGVSPLTQGEGIKIQNNVVSIDDTVVQKLISVGTGITKSGNTLSVDTGVIQELISAGTGITKSGNTISVNLDTIQAKLTSGTGITLTGNTISVNLDTIQKKITAGNGITLDATTNILSIDEDVVQEIITVGTGLTKVGNEIAVNFSQVQAPITAGTGITKSGNVISVEDNKYQEKLVAGTNITIGSDGKTISAPSVAVTKQVYSGSTTSLTELRAFLDKAIDNIVTFTAIRFDSNNIIGSFNGTITEITPNINNINTIYINGSGYYYDGSKYYPVLSLCVAESTIFFTYIDDTNIKRTSTYYTSVTNITTLKLLYC